MDRTEAAKLVEILRKQCADYAKHFPDVWKKIDMLLSRRPELQRQYQRYAEKLKESMAAYEVAKRDTQDCIDAGIDPNSLVDVSDLDKYKPPPKIHEAWPDWCFMPVSVLDSNNPLDLKEAWMNRSRIPELLTMGAWRQTQGVYLIDETVLDELWKTPLTGKIPAEILYRLPEWTTLINLPDRAFELAGGGRMALCHVTTVGQYVSIIIQILEPGGLGTISMPLLGTLEESLAFMIDCLNNPEQAKLDVTAFGKEGSHWARDVFTLCAHDIAGVLSTLLYLCSEEPDIQGKPVKPIKTMTKQGPRFFPPDKPKEIMVGVRLGAALRRGREARSGQETDVRGTHASPRAHIRGAHWHLYWTGPRSQPVAVVKWLPPIPVNTKFGETDAVIHLVEEKVSA